VSRSDWGASEFRFIDANHTLSAAAAAHSIRFEPTCDFSGIVGNPEITDLYGANVWLALPVHLSALSPDTSRAATGNCELHEEETHPTYSGRIVSKEEVMRFLAVGPLFAHNPKEARSRLNTVSEAYSFRIRDSFGGTNWRSIPYKQSWKRYWQTSAIPFAF
jgi:hypothetical protein